VSIFGDIVSGIGSAASGLGGMATGAIGGLGGMGVNAIGGLASKYFGGGSGSSPQGGYTAPPGYTPQSFGGGPWPAFPGQPNGNPQPQKFTGDFSTAGPMEKFFADNQGRYTAPGQGQAWYDANKGSFGPGQADQYWNGVAGRGQTAPPQTTNYAKDAYQAFTGGSPQDMSPFYDNAVRKTGEGIERAYAARGMRGGSAELDQLSEANTNLRAQEARDNASYGLQRYGLGGQLASGADASSGRDVQNQLGWLTGMGGLGLGVQNADLNRLMAQAGIASGLDSTNLNWLNSGMNAANAAQGAMATRGQNFFNNNLNATQAETNPMMGIYLQMLQNDAALQNAAIDASTGYAREGANQSVQGRAQTEQGIGNLFSLMGKMGGGMF
jgi:hypothetical protein